MYPQTQQLLRELVTQKIVPGVSYALLNHSEVLTEVSGWREVTPKKEKLRPGLQYDLASLTKVIGTATVIFQLVEAGKLSLSDSVQKYLPEFQDDRVQVWHLLTHTSGVAGYIPNRDQLAAPELKTALLRLPVTATFEQKVVYTDVGLLYLGWIIETIYQQPVQQVIKEQVLQPLELRGATFTPDPANCVPTNTRTGQLLRGVVHDPKARTLGKNCGSAGLFASLHDLIQFAQWYLGQRPDLAQLISPSFIKGLYADHTRHQLGRSLAWDLCQPENLQLQPLLYHTGYTGTLLLLDDELQQGLIVLTNRVHPREQNSAFLEWRERIVRQFMQELPEKR
ncbi:serine hydrolase domain-containing protein [Lapidilactobacillus bayanensis]|uniref:serine hydrolase domain-containing protein n=1 Tax=Lapidilactobacillus bayanensis TaxID=2485998 RepID=UPI000F7B0C31|nr:serine hydrolase domain-containing protein [Lapidilactobacillus bayanensis]